MADGNIAKAREHLNGKLQTYYLQQKNPIALKMFCSFIDFNSGLAIYSIWPAGYWSQNLTKQQSNNITIV